MDLIHEVESYGSLVSLDGDRIMVTNFKRLPSSTVDKLKSHKSEIIEVLTHDMLARKNGFLPLHSGEVYERQLTQEMHVFIMREHGTWSSWRESFKAGTSAGIKPLAYKGSTFNVALMRAKEYVDYMTRTRRRAA